MKYSSRCLHPVLLGILLLAFCAVSHAVPPRNFDAKALGASSGLEVIEDVAPEYIEINKQSAGVREARSTPAVALVPDGKPITLDLGQLPVGMYHVDILARIDREMTEEERAPTRWDQKNLFELRKLPRIRRPIFLHLKINDGPKGAASDYRMLVNYSDDYTPDEFDFSLQRLGPTTARFFFQVNEPRSIKVELRIGDGSLEGLRVKRVTLADFFEGFERTRAKSRPMLFTLEERAREREQAKLQSTTAPVLDAAARQARDDIIWNALPRFNTQHYGQHGGAKDHYSSPFGLTVFGGAAGPTELKDNPQFKDLGAWYLAGVDPDDIHVRQWNVPIAPLLLKHRPSGAEYSAAEMYANKPLPQRPFNEWPQGAFFPAEETGALNRNHYIFTVGELMHRRYLQFIYALDGSADDTGLKLVSKYHRTGDKAVARDAALLLIRLAYAWPALQLNYQDLGQIAANPELDYGIDTRGGWKAGKIYYHGWSGPQWQQLLRSYDKLFDFIDGNEELARAVNRYLPWIKTPDDVVALLDTYLVRAGIKDFKERRIAGDNPSEITTAALVLGKGKDAEDLMDLSKTWATMYPISAPWLDLIASAINRDGTHYIGSWGYARGAAYGLLDLARDAERFKAAGGKLKFDATDITRFPKIAAAASTLLDAQMAGGYSLNFGDASGNIWTGRGLVNENLVDQRMEAETANLAWRFTHDPRYAWLIVNIFGRTDQDDAAWKEIETAAKTTRDPRLHTQSRVLGGLGAAILERGTDFRDFRLKEAVLMRTGSGQGHAHADALDLNYFALGARMAADTATRSEGQFWSEPPSMVSMLHNTVEVDGKQHPWRSENDWPPGNFGNAEAWMETFKPLGDVQFMAGAAQSTVHPDVSLFLREVAHIGVEPGKDSTQPLPEKITRETKLPSDITLPRSYIFDVFRVSGGRWHTWAFHGAVSDEFQVNSDMRKLSPDETKDNETDKLSRNYLRKMHDPQVSTSKDIVEATWRLSRTGGKYQTVKGEIETEPGEQNMLGANYDEAAPRRYTRVSLLGHGGNPLLVGSPYSLNYKYLFPFLYVQLRGEEKGRESVFPAIIEAYQGEPTVTSKKLLTIEGNDTDALRAIAVEVQTRNGHTDICFAGGRPDKERTVAGNKMSGEFAYISRDAQGLRQATLVGGKVLQAGDLSVNAAQDKYAAQITAVDYDKRQLTLDRELPMVMVGQQVRIFNEDHHTSYTIEAVQNANGHATLTFTRDALMARSSINKIEEDKVTLAIKPFAGHEVANRNKGWTATNETNSKFWKTAAGGWDAMYRFAGAPVATEDFTDADGDDRATVVMYDYGPGDALELPIHVSITRTAQGYAVLSDVSAELKIGAKSCKLEPSAKAMLVK